MLRQDVIDARAGRHRDAHGSYIRSVRLERPSIPAGLSRPDQAALRVWAAPTATSAMRAWENCDQQMLISACRLGSAMVVESCRRKTSLEAARRGYIDQRRPNRVTSGAAAGSLGDTRSSCRSRHLPSLTVPVHTPVSAEVDWMTLPPIYVLVAVQFSWPVPRCHICIGPL